jgi:D-alanyl-D-alanine carboxypeptidase (penicillin-binding protein 5/6)
MTESKLQPIGRRWVLYTGLAALVVIAGAVALRLALPEPAPKVTQTVPAAYVVPGTPPAVPWPGTGQATVEVEGLGGLGSSGESRPVPIASVAKMMTAYLVLHEHPMGTDQNGPTLTITPDEAAAYPAQLASGQSLVKVEAGEVLTERQALQALLLPSANNIAYILGRWIAGGQDTFVARMNQTAAELGMAQTHYTDPSGLDEKTVSTALDQVKLARKAMAVPALAQIVALKEATIPVAGLVRNVNKLLGADGIVGIKTGSTDQAGGCLVFAASVDVAGHPLTVLGAVLGAAGGMSDAFTASQRLVQTARDAVHPYRVVQAGQQVASVVGAMGRTTTLVAAGDVEVLGWPGLTYRVDTSTTVPRAVASGAGVGTLQLTASAPAASTPVRTAGSLAPPGWWERLTRR